MGSQLSPVRPLWSCKVISVVFEFTVAGIPPAPPLHNYTVLPKTLGSPRSNFSTMMVPMVISSGHKETIMKWLHSWWSQGPLPLIRMTTLAERCLWRQFPLCHFFSNPSEFFIFLLPFQLAGIKPRLHFTVACVWKISDWKCCIL